MAQSIWANIFFMLGGIAVLMFGMRIMGSNLEQVAENRMKQLLGKMTSNRFAGVGVGAAVTAIINSSTATTVMLVGFVNVGLMTLVQATSVIMGANVGTTITAQILSLTGSGFEVAAIAALLAAIGIMLVTAFRKDKIHKIGYILLGLGLIFIGLKIMSVSVDGIIWQDKESGILYPFFENLFKGDIFPLLLILIGAMLTALVHSSAAVTGILIALGAALNFQTAVFIILGSNVGTCVTSLVSSIGTNTNAKRTAVIHLLFNLFGCVICIIPVWIWGAEFESLMIAISGASIERQIANFHTLFNIFTTLLLLPFIKPLCSLATKIVPEKETPKDSKHKLTYLDARLLETPAIAVINVKKEIEKMADIAKENIGLSMDMLLDESVEQAELLKENEEALNFLNHNITKFITKLMGKELTRHDEKVLGTYYHVVTDIERVGDYAENILEYSERLRSDESDFSDDAKYELKQLTNTIDVLFEKSMSVFKKLDLEMLKEVDELEESVDLANEELENRHIDRLKKNQCSATIGSIFLQVISNLERVGDHITNIAYSVKGYTRQ